MLDSLLKRNIEIQLGMDSRVAGRVEIRKGTEVINSTIRGPVSIAEGCRIVNSFIGPFTSIGAGSVIEDSSIEHSVVMKNCRISQTERLSDSLIGKGTEVKRGAQNFRVIRLFIGDDARIEL